jgi:hypothetical protein
MDAGPSRQRKHVTRRCVGVKAWESTVYARRHHDDGLYSPTDFGKGDAMRSEDAARPG